MVCPVHHRLAVFPIDNPDLQSGPSPVPLNTAGNYVILAETGISTVPSSAISVSSTPLTFTVLNVIF
jgi:hypothetical protein